MTAPRFTVIALPRSGTAWTSALLTTSGSVCVHEGSIFAPPKCGRRYGIADTSLFLTPEQTNAMDCEKLVILRDYHAVTRSLIRANLPVLSWEVMRLIEWIEGPKIRFSDLFDADVIKSHFERLTGQPFDRARHEKLRRHNIQNFELMRIVREMAA